MFFGSNRLARKEGSKTRLSHDFLIFYIMEYSEKEAPKAPKAAKAPKGAKVGSVCVPKPQYNAEKAELERLRAKEKAENEKQAAKDKADLERYRANEAKKAE